MRVSLNVTNYSWPETGTFGSRLAPIVRAADAGGLDTLWVADHLIQGDPTNVPEAAMLEAFTTLGYCAAQSTRIRLGTMVSAVTYRRPSMLIKAVTTLDVLSGGRAWLGIGAGYHGQEANWLGLSLPPMAERFERLEETLQLALLMWAGDDSPFLGRHYTLERPLSSPPPATRPHPPILIGGMGERKTLPMVARYADACNLFDIPDGGATVTRRLNILRAACDAAGRSFDDLDRSVSTRLGADESAESFLRRSEALGALGFTHIVAITGAPWSEASVDTLARVAAEVATDDGAACSGASG